MKEDRSEIYAGFSVARKPAPLTKRVLALVVDYGIVGACVYVAVAVFLVVGMFAYLGLLSLFSGVDLVAYVLSALAIVLALAMALASAMAFDWYFVRCEFKTGTTLGKRLFGLRVVSISGEPLTFRQVLIRDLMRYLDVLLFFPGLISCVATQRSQRLGDLMAGTMVVHSDLFEAKDSFLFVSQEDYWLFHDVLQPTPVDDHTAKGYSVFAHRNLRTGVVDPTNHSSWLAIARKHIANPKNKQIDESSLLLFFAEYCRQQQLKKKGE